MQATEEDGGYRGWGMILRSTLYLGKDDSRVHVGHAGILISKVFEASAKGA